VTILFDRMYFKFFSNIFISSMV